MKSLRTGAVIEISPTRWRSSTCEVQWRHKRTSYFSAFVRLGDTLTILGDSLLQLPPWRITCDGLQQRKWIWPAWFNRKFLPSERGRSYFLLQWSNQWFDSYPRNGNSSLGYKAREHSVVECWSWHDQWLRLRLRIGIQCGTTQTEGLPRNMVLYGSRNS